MKRISNYKEIKEHVMDNKAKSKVINYGLKKVVTCNTCMFVYDRTKKKETKTHKAFHYSYLAN